MSGMIISFDQPDIHKPQPWPIGIDSNDIVLSGLGPDDDGAKLIGFGPVGQQTITVSPAQARENPELCVGLCPSFSDGSFFEWAIPIKEVTVRA